MARTDASDSRAPGAPIRAARLARVRMIRRRVITGAVGLFVAVWMLIAVTLVTGHDPALAKRSSAAASSGSSTTATPTSSGSSSSGTSDTSSSSSDAGSSTSSASNGSSTSGLSAVTTSQS